MKRTESRRSDFIPPIAVLYTLMAALMAAVFPVTTFTTAAKPASEPAPSNESPEPLRGTISIPSIGDAWTPVGETPSLLPDSRPWDSATASVPGIPLPLPFASKPELDRCVLDCDLRKAWNESPNADGPFPFFDATRVDAFRLNIGREISPAIGHVMLYLRSGDGWYGMSGNVTKKTAGVSEIIFSPDDCRIEGTPAGLDRIDGLRLAFWRGAAMDSDVRLVSLDSMRYPILIVESSATGPEGDTARRCAQEMADTLRSLCSGSVRFTRIPESDLTPASLEDREVVILPYNPGMSDAAATLLAGWLESQPAAKANPPTSDSPPSPNPRLVAFYQLPAPLVHAAGFDRLEYVRSPDGDAALATVRFDDAAQNDAGYPAEFRQRSHNINVPIFRTTGDDHDPQTFGTWYDAAGRATAWPALVTTDRAIFFSHVLLGQDAENQRRMVTAMLAEAYQWLWQRAALTAMEESINIGDRSGLEWMRKLPPEKRTLTPPERESFRSLSAALREHDRLSGTVTKRNFLGDFEPPSPQRNRDLRRAIVRLGELKRLFADVYIRSIDSAPAGEVRAWWEHAGTGIYPGDWDRTMRELSKSGFTHVIPNMLWAGSAHYESDCLPPDDVYIKYGDQIAQAVAAGRKCGVQVHIWKVNYNLDTAPAEFVDRMREERRTQVKADGTPQRWLCPSHPANQELEIASMCEIVKKYDVDGIHFDYIRYPSDDVCFCDGCRERFESQTGRNVKNWPADCYRGECKDIYTDWRCEQITKVVAGVHDRAKRIRPTIQISAAVFPLHPECRRWVLQDWPVWVQAGYLDFICPMSYNADPAAFAGWIRRELEQVGGKIPVYPGIGATATGIAMTPDIVAAEIAATRDAGAAGFTIFNLDARTAERFLQRLRPLFAETDAGPENDNISDAEKMTISKIPISGVMP